jgi:hypothetical protein
LIKGVSRPRVESSVTQHDRHSHRLIVDLIAQRDKIFKELKRQSIRKNRPESLDESHRRERYEARSRAVSAAHKSPRLAPADLANGSGGDKSPMTHPKRVVGISGILGNRPPSLQLEPGDNLSLDGGALPAGGVDENTDAATAAVEVKVTNESADDGPVKKPSLGRSHRIGRPVGLQRHIKRESVQQGESGSATADMEDRNAATATTANMKRGSEAGRFGGVTLSDGPTRE